MKGQLPGKTPQKPPQLGFDDLVCFECIWCYHLATSLFCNVCAYVCAYLYVYYVRVKLGIFLKLSISFVEAVS